MSVAAGPYLHVGNLPGKKGVWLYELDCGVFRALARFDCEANARRLLKFNTIPRLKNLEKGIPCEVEVEGFSSDNPTKKIMKRRKPLVGVEE